MLYSLPRQLRLPPFQPFRFLPAQRSSTSPLLSFTPKLNYSSLVHSPGLNIRFTKNCIPQSSRSRLYRYGVAGLGLGLSLLFPKTIYCEPVPSGGTQPAPGSTEANASPADFPPPPPPTSNVSLIELSFGTVCGICTGVFVKKGAKALAFMFGGVFVLLQYLGSLSSGLRVDWTRMGKRFENLFYSKDAQGISRPPNVGSLFRWFVDFLTADFQQRASFIAGFALGLRIG